MKDFEVAKKKTLSYGKDQASRFMAILLAVAVSNWAEHDSKDQ